MAKKKTNIDIEINTKVVIKGMEDRNTCPECNSDFTEVYDGEFITCKYYKMVMQCRDCGHIFTHYYKLIYSHSDI